MFLFKDNNNFKNLIRIIRVMGIHLQFGNNSQKLDFKTINYKKDFNGINTVKYFVKKKKQLKN